MAPQDEPPLRLADLGEDEIVRRLTHALPLSPGTVAGAGDDCAVLATADRRWLQLFKTDCIVERIHFLPDTPPRKIGWKALCRCISDIAAMGGLPTEAVVTVAAPADLPWRRLSGIYTGLKTACRKFGVGLVGGETSRVPPGAPLLLSVAMLGRVERRCLVQRSGGRPDDLVFVTGRLGGSLRGWHLDFSPRMDAARWLAARFRPTAMMDLSDGLAADLPRLAAASGTGWEVFPSAVPRRSGCTLTQALHDGEDYELLFCLPPRRCAALVSEWKRAFPKLPLTCIGRLTADTKCQNGMPPGGWQHFQ
ncbi:MAG: thiamine-monophosphate kinase [Verrucomicrobiales bacterium]|nr:thiamine-monophosphate kinase [Verrucomicrobiales bacterium]